MQTLESAPNAQADRTYDAAFDTAPFRLEPLSAGESTEAIDRESLYRDFAPLVCRLTIHYGVSADLREELRGEIYCRFCAFYDQFDPTRGIPIRPYMVRQLSASIYTFVRSYRRHAGRELGFEPGIDELHQGLRHDPTDSWTDQLTLQSIMGVLPTAFAHLPDRQRKVVLWRYIDDWSFEQIAHRLEIKPATARSLLRHGLTGLRKWFAANRIDPPSS